MQRLPRLAVLTLPDLGHFMPDLAEALAQTQMLSVRVFPVRGPDDLRAALAWTDRPALDTVWFEFCWPPFPAMIAATGFDGRRVVVRVHRIEAYETDHVARTDWTKVTDLIVVSGDMARCVREVRPGIDALTRLHVIHNGLDLARYPARTGFDPTRIGWCGSFIARKNPTLALQILHRLAALDDRYRLCLAISGGDRLTMEAFCHQAATLRLADRIEFDGQIAAHAMPGWHQRNGVLLSTSLHESFGYAIAEAAAAGCDLAILDHVGAAEFWPAETRFVAVDDAVHRIQAAAPDRWRAHVCDAFPLDRQVAAVLHLLAASRPPETAGSARYWEARYRAGGNSGAGSTGRLARFKADTVNRLVAEHGLHSVVELGCGDGRQLALARYGTYVGVDVAAAAVAQCRQRFAGDPGKSFALASDADLQPADLALSLDVVFHLTEDDVYHAYMERLFGLARRMVVIYASDRDEPTRDAHVRHRAISAWVATHAPAWRRLVRVANPYPFDPRRPDDTSFADLHVFVPTG